MRLQKNALTDTVYIKKRIKKTLRLTHCVKTRKNGYCVNRPLFYNRRVILQQTRHHSTTDACAVQTCFFRSKKTKQVTAKNYQLKLLTRVYCSMSTSKSKNKKASSTENLIQLTHLELEIMLQGIVANAIKPLEAEIKALKTEVNTLRESQQFISNQNDDLNKSYKSALLSNKQQKQSITE